MQAVLSKICKK